MCGKKDLSTIEGDGGTECELSDGRWTCGIDCYVRATETPMEEGLWRFWNEKAKTYLAERDSLKALCDEMAKALEEAKFALFSSDMTIKDRADQSMRLALAALAKAKEADHG